MSLAIPILVTPDSYWEAKIIFCNIAIYSIRYGILCPPTEGLVNFDF
ncbi:MAG: hypothetical protein ABII90_15565 [Bacteroidota bacterium]